MVVTGANSNTLFATELANVKDYSRRFAKQMDKTTEIGKPLDPWLVPGPCEWR